MKRLKLLALAGISIGLIGCGGSHTAQVPHHPAPESARTPDGGESAIERTLPPPTTPGVLGSGQRIEVSNYGVNFVGGFEGFSSCPYWDSYGGVLTRGYGETAFTSSGFEAPPRHGCIGRAQALTNLRNLLNNSYLWPLRKIGGSFNQCQIDAAASASYNLGPGILLSHASSLRAHSAYFLLGYVRAGGVTLSGLVRRRRAEVALFYSHGGRCAPPRPETRAHKAKRLHAAERRVRVLRAALGGHGCRQALKRRRAGPRCRRWAREGAARHAEIRTLHRQGVR